MPAGSARETQGAERRRLIRLAYAINSKAGRVGASGRVTAEDLGRILLANPMCEYCGVTLEPGHGSFDHRIPFDSGGQNVPSNITRCCVRCQRSKFTMPYKEWLVFMNLTLPCAVCGKQFRPRHTEWKSGRAKTCSHRCAATYRWRS